MKALDYILKNSPIFHEIQSFVLVSECDLGDCVLFGGKKSTEGKPAIFKG